MTIVVTIFYICHSQILENMRIRDKLKIGQQND